MSCVIRLSNNRNATSRRGLRDRIITMLQVCAALLVLCVGAMAAPSVVQMKMMDIAPAQMRHPKAHVSFQPYQDTWTQFKASHGKTYQDEQEENLRFNVFMNHVKMIEKHNSLYHSGQKSYFLGLNQFADMTNLEFRQYNGFGRHLLGGKADPESPCNTTYLSPHFVVLPDSVDWREKGYVTPVKNQGQCGSCWSFSTTGSVEGQHYRKSGTLVSLSEQQLVDCSGKYGNQGCNGGLMDEAFAYIMSVGGLETETEYPYDAKDEKCHFKKRDVAATISGCVDVPSQDEEKLKEAVGTVGPVSVAIDASHASFQLYSGGVYDEPECSSTELDHGVLTAGYGTSDEGDDYWLVKNSWGTKWGEEGYIKMSRNKKNQCGIATQASYPLV